MAKKELRLAVVIYGGASLAVYMHGITKELLKLVRASKVLHELGPRRAERTAYRDGPDHRAFDTEAVYFDILKEINRRDHFRVVIDVVAGASAGAINGVMLAKALVDDALLDAQTSGWLNDADAEHLGARKVTWWNKWYLHPFLRALAYWLPRDIARNPETRGKIARLVRSAWFQPPFSGERLCHHFFDALDALRASRREGSSLLPPGQRLDVYASITDLVGYPRTIRLHDELVAREQEHAAFCQLSHVASETGRSTSDFLDGNAPALVWAARASSSFAGAFPPFHHRELMRVAAARGLPWLRERSFLRTSVRARDGSPAVRHFDPADRYFIDGGIVNNKPFGAALEALNHRAADRQVERYLAYIEPNPTVEEVAHPERDLGYLSTIRAALSTIPRNQPIVDDLSEVVAQDARVRVNRRIIDVNRGQIETMVEDLRAAHASRTMSAGLLTALRAGMAARARGGMGLAYGVYVQRLVWRLVDALVEAWSALLPGEIEPNQSRDMQDTLAQWWRQDGPPGDPQENFLDRFDVSFRIRRLQFLIRRLNRHGDDRSLDEASRTALDDFKQRAYEFMEQCYRLRRSEQLEHELVSALAEAAQQLPMPADQALALLRRLADSLGLEALDRSLDQAFFEFQQRLMSEPLRETLIGDYVGFQVYDVLLLAPGSLEGGPDPLTPISVERISPADSRSLGDVFEGLRCRRFMGLVGFFNRGYREHDYLWGRLNAAERIVDMLVGASDDLIKDPPAFKRRLFKTIIDRERKRLYRCDDVLDRLDRHLLTLE